MKVLLALIKKEIKQMLRDSSCIIIAFVLPVISLLIYMYGVNLDSNTVTIGIKNDDNNNPEIATLIKSFGHSKYINSVVLYTDEELDEAIRNSKIKGAVVIPNDFSTKLSRGQNAELLVITDGSEANTANYVQSYITSIANGWLASSKYRTNMYAPIISPEVRFWYNPDQDSHYFIMPGSMATSMTLIGILLTSLVVAREWDRGTMEGLLSTRVRPIYLVLSKYIPYFILGMASLAFSVFLCIFVFGIPFMGSFLSLFVVSGLFLFACLGIGIMISTLLRNQFQASLVAIGVGFMPGLMLSGMVFPINSMPDILQKLTMFLPPRYYVAFIESEFMAGSVKKIILENAVFLTILGLLLFAVVLRNTKTRLER
ncbi:MAG: ABC transporter permease [Phascolarctobacterium sp.]|nr:ABC transporter permease [Phascolarctobacterium sp.]